MCRLGDCLTYALKSGSYLTEITLVLVSLVLYLCYLFSSVLLTLVVVGEYSLYEPIYRPSAVVV